MVDPPGGDDAWIARYFRERAEGVESMQGMMINNLNLVERANDRRFFLRVTPPARVYICVTNLFEGGRGLPTRQDNKTTSRSAGGSAVHVAKIVHSVAGVGRGLRNSSQRT